MTDHNLEPTYVYRGDNGELRYYAPTDIFIHRQPVGAITPRNWNPVELVLATRIACEAGWHMLGCDPLMMGVGQDTDMPYERWLNKDLRNRC